MSRINEIIASMPPGVAAAVVHLREVHSCLMELDTNHARALAARAIYLDYMEGEGRKLSNIPRYYERVNSKGEKVNVETYFCYINRVH
nr:MAG TPA: hypothetical protein [Caudoviricetes sp.]